MEAEKSRELNLMAARIRKCALEAIQAANSGHIGGSFSLAELLAVLYFDRLRIDSDHPRWQERDRFVLSKGHCTPAVYATLALRGFFPVEDLQTFRHIDSYLSGHIEMNHVPGVDMSAGSLGQGVSVAAGMALSAKAFGNDWRVYAVTGDGELQEGQIWEAAMAAAHYKLDNLCVLTDNNGLQLDGTLEQVMSPYPIAEKFTAFGWHVIEADGHDVAELAAALDGAAQTKGKPTLILCHTVKGKGVSLFENGVKWHGGRPTAEEYALAYRELDAQIARWEGKA